MHIYVIAQYLNLQSVGEDRFYKLGRECIARGQSVTFFTSGAGSGLSLGKKKIGLLKRDGITLVGFNVPYSAKMGGREKFAAFVKFARMVNKQGRLLPKPDLVVAATPPLSSVLPALKLTKHFSVPLLLEIRELWPDAPIERGTLNNRLLIGAARKIEARAYEQAGKIVALTPEIAAAVKQRGVEPSRVKVISEGLDEQNLIQSYEQLLKNLVQKKQIIFDSRKFK